MPSAEVEKAWVVVRVARGSPRPANGGVVHFGFIDPRPAELLCDILNSQNADPEFEFRVLEMPPLRISTQERPS